MQRIRVLVVDDHRIFAESLAAALAAEQDVEVTAVGSGAAAVHTLERGAAEGRRFAVLLVDAHLSGPGPAPPADESSSAAPPPPGPSGAAPLAIPSPRSELTPGQLAGGRDGSPGAGQGSAAAGPGGLTLLARMCTAHPGLRAVVLAERDDPAVAAAALQAGACGWVAKDSSLSRLLHVVRGVLKGETHLPPLLLTGVLEELTASREHRSESERLVHALTPREYEVLRCMVAGLGRKAVAERLYLSPRTVRTHMQNVLGKLGVHSTLAAVALARRAGVPPAGPDAADS
ncbi:response regulator transcription factor [Streptomyces sp. RKND-216]|uniref:response regulator transcription factor n=1 Tax=Streptomyces sp. RKND-216 TaxID=2562581 RepID=UPI00109DE4D1|nr:response regulator transcription factor [Streptomyces sp. RKND-216]THA26029.1 response regulator transcription factor [Streptomyces sp. RKND-216]